MVNGSELEMKTAYGVEIPENLRELVDPNRCALIVYDMQAGILRQIADGTAITERVREVLNVVRKAGIRVFYTRHLSLPSQLMGAFQFRTAMAWQRVEDPEKVQPWFLRDSPAFQIVPEVQPTPSEAVFDKLTMSAFEGTPLAMALRDCKIQAFLILGVAMEIGIDITCRRGRMVKIFMRRGCSTGVGRQGVLDSGFQVADRAQAEQGQGRAERCSAVIGDEAL